MYFMERGRLSISCCVTDDVTPCVTWVLFGFGSALEISATFLARNLACRARLASAFLMGSLVGMVNTTSNVAISDNKVQSADTAKVGYMVPDSKEHTHPLMGMKHTDNNIHGKLWGEYSLYLDSFHYQGAFLH
jgi:hypothetical protein